MRAFVYRLPFDVGFAPNPFWGRLTLACCKPLIRRKSQPGDLIFALTPRHGEDRLIWAGRVSEKMTWDEYVADPRFAAKRPRVAPGVPRVQRAGDRCYERVDGEWRQLVGEHWSWTRWTENENNRSRDLSGPVVVCEEFSYLGRLCILLPPQARFITKVLRALQYRWSEDQISTLEILFRALPKGVVGEPLGWRPSARLIQKRGPAEARAPTGP